MLLLTGIGGAGKSTLATRLANRCQQEGFKLMVLRAREDDVLGFCNRLAIEAADLCFEMNLERQEKMLRNGERDLDERLRLFVRVLNEQKILLVLDYLEELLNLPAAQGWKDETVATFFKTLFSRLTGKGRAILTCRYLLPDFDPQQLQLDWLSLSDFAEADFFKYLRSNVLVSKRLANGELSNKLLKTFYLKLGATPRFLEQACAILQNISVEALQS